VVASKEDDELSKSDAVSTHVDSYEESVAASTTEAIETCSTTASEEDSTLSTLGSCADLTLLDVPEPEADDLLAGLVKLVEAMTVRHDPWDDSAKPTCFDCVGSPKISLSDFAHRIQKYFAFTDECIVLIALYIERVVQSCPHFKLTHVTSHKLLLATAAIAAKFHDDEYYDNKFFAKVGGVTTKRLNGMEAELLRMLDWRLYVERSDFDRCLSKMIGFD
jgi:hypothetical protein